MSYLMTLWALPPGGLERELTSPAIDPADVDDRGGTLDEVIRNWPLLASTVAGAVADGGGELVGDLAVYAEMVVATLGHQYGSLHHTSAGGEQFRERFLGQVATDALGRDYMVHLVNRAVAGLTWADYPMIGWVSAAESGAAAERAAAAPSPDDLDATALRTLLRAAARCGRLNLDLVSVYG